MNTEDPAQVLARIREATKEIISEIPVRLGIRQILNDAFNKLSDAAGKEQIDSFPAIVHERLVDVLREIATHAVEEFTRRTGQPFLWQDEPEELPESEPLMSFGIEVKNGKGNVTF